MGFVEDEDEDEEYCCGANSYNVAPVELQVDAESSAFFAFRLSRFSYLGLGVSSFRKSYFGPLALKMLVLSLVMVSRIMNLDGYRNGVDFFREGYVIEQLYICVNICELDINHFEKSEQGNGMDCNMI